MVTEVTAWTSSTAWIGGHSGEARTEQEKPLCMTPCVTALSSGLHVLRFKSETDTGTSDVVVQLDHGSKVVRHTLGRVNEGSEAANFTAIMLAVLGGTSLFIGSLVLATADDGPPSKVENKERAGAALVAGGGGAVVLSIPLFLLGRGTRQPGATTEFEF